MKLTFKQQAFVTAYLQHGNGSEAYRTAYPTSLKWTPQAVAEHASRLLAKDKIKPIIDEAREKSLSEAIATRSEALVILTEVMRNPRERAADRRAAIETLAKLQGWNEPDKSVNASYSEFVFRIVQGVQGEPPECLK